MADLFGAMESRVARTPRQPALPAAAPRAPEPAPLAIITEPQRHALRTAAALLCGHFTADAATWLRQAGPFGAAALAAIEAGATPMNARTLAMRALDQAEQDARAQQRRRKGAHG